MSAIASSRENVRSDSPRSRIRRAWRGVGNWWREQSTTLVGREARRGGVWGLIAVLTLFVAVRLVFLSSGLSFLFDAVFVSAAGAVIVLLTAMVIAVTLTAIRRLPVVGTGVFVGTCLLLIGGWFSTPSISLGIAVISFSLAACALGATLGALTSARTAVSTTAAKTLTSVVGIASTAYIVGFVGVLADTGDVEKVSSWRPRDQLMPANLSFPNPGSGGTYLVRTLFYGSGSDVRREEYNSGVGIKTRTVDASTFFRGYPGWKRWARSRYWGFDLDKLPLNARVWYPEGAGPFPLVLVAHGNHRMNDFSLRRRGPG